MSGGIWQMFRDLDLFSKPFVFFVGDKKKKSTVIGGVLSLMVLLVSGIYFYYLISMYFRNKIEPKISTSIAIEDQHAEIGLEEDSIIFELLVNGEPLKQMEKRLGKMYLTYQVTYDQFLSDGSLIKEVIPQVECTNSQFKGFLCLDPSMITTRGIYIDPIKISNSDYSVTIQFCDQTKYTNCADPQDIQDTIFQPTNFFQLFIKIKQYDTANRVYKNNFKSEYFYFDPEIIIFARMSLIKATTNVSEGLIIQTTESLDSIYDFKRIDSIFSKTDIEKRMGFNGFAFIVYEINQVQNIVTIQHAMITEVLAQFMSIFNTILVIGIIAKMLAETQIIEDINEILLKEYYKRTALMLIRQREKRKSFIQKPDRSQQGEASLANLDFSHKISELQKKIFNTNFAEESRKFFKVSIFNRIKVFVSNIMEKSPELHNSEQDHELVVYQHLLNQSVKRINIFEVYKDLIKLKMVTKLLLSKEQFAALQFCGSEIPEENEKSLQKVVVIEDQDGQEIPQNMVSDQAKVKQPNSAALFSSQNDLQFKTQGPPQLMQSSTQQIYIDGIEVEDNVQEDKIKDQQNQDEKLPNKYNEEGQSKNVIDIGNNDNLNSRVSLEPKSSQDNPREEEEQDNVKIQPLKEQKYLSVETKKQQKQHLVSINENESPPIELEIISQNKIEYQNKVDQIDYTNKDYNEDCFDNINENLENNYQVKSQGFNQSPKIKSHFNPVRSHLYQMDEIEDNPELQEQYLQSFLKGISEKLKQKNSKEITQIDKNIFQSLLFHETIKQIPSMKDPPKVLQIDQLIPVSNVISSNEMSNRVLSVIETQRQFNQNDCLKNQQ